MRDQLPDHRLFLIAGLDQPGLARCFYFPRAGGIDHAFLTHQFWTREGGFTLAAGDHLPDGSRGRLLRQLYPGPCARVAQGGAFWLQ